MESTALPDPFSKGLQHRGLLKSLLQQSKHTAPASTDI
jgi:hypothetical protein